MPKAVKRRRTVTVRKPGQPGTKKWLETYGPALRRVRYVADHETGERYISIELIQRISGVGPSHEKPPAIWVGIEIAPDEKELKRQVRAAGGRYDTQDRLWLLPFEAYKKLGLDVKRYTIREEFAEYRI
jgi:hypothetical protein